LKQRRDYQRSFEAVSKIVLLGDGRFQFRGDRCAVCGEALFKDSFFDKAAVKHRGGESLPGLHAFAGSTIN
jgi:hypothetical protein